MGLRRCLNAWSNKHFSGIFQVNAELCMYFSSSVKHLFLTNGDIKVEFLKVNTHSEWILFELLTEP